jgi:hypothetical protein
MSSNFAKPLQVRMIVMISVMIRYFFDVVIVFGIYLMINQATISQIAKLVRNSGKVSRGGESHHQASG